MALVKCPDCDQDVSSEAWKCPRCGKPMVPETVRRVGEHLVSNAGKDFKWAIKASVITVSVCGVLLAAVTICSGLMFPPQ